MFVSYREECIYTVVVEGIFVLRFVVMITSIDLTGNIRSYIVM